MVCKENRLVVGDEEWAKSLPDWLLERVKEERIVLGLMSVVNPGIEKVGDAEVLAYLIPASFRAPLTYTYTQIFLYLVTQVCGRNGKSIPLEIKVTELSKDQERELSDLRAMIYEKRGGEINNPILNFMRQQAKICRRCGKAVKSVKDLAGTKGKLTF